ncbi:prepilin-type N-terminal cleavage/methylation domain-containing protein [Candidatus Nomurabacteria bacterium]|nr:prepilin-type N-terminal cleavage/methylation domain-containing protein [Candidatus Nomurabacteria bacterium]
MKNFNNQKNKKGGYTILETMISLSIFLIIILSGMSSLLNANIVYNRSNSFRTVLDNLSFIVEDISRNLRTGYNVRCVDDGNYSTSQDVPKSCSLGGGIIFESDVGSAVSTGDQWIYKVESPNGVDFGIYKSTNGGTSFNSMTVATVYLDSSSGFSVLGAPSSQASPQDSQQPLTTIKLSGWITHKGVNIPFSLQTSVSQRRLDI